MTATATPSHTPSASSHRPPSVRSVLSGSGALRLPSPSRALALALVLASLAFFPAIGFAQMAQLNKPATPASAAVSNKAPAAAPGKAAHPSRPSWVELTPLQQQTLQPLALSWNTISEAQKRKWLEISRNYHSLPPQGQATMHSRMNEWVALSPRQRAEARLNFAKTKELSKQLTPEEKKAKWQTYQALSPEEKEKLAAKATRRPVGAALAVKPVAPQKLATVPPHGVKPAAKPATKIAPAQTTTPQPPAGVPTPQSAAAAPQN